MAVHTRTEYLPEYVHPSNPTNLHIRTCMGWMEVTGGVGGGIVEFPRRAPRQSPGSTELNCLAFIPWDGIPCGDQRWNKQPFPPSTFPSEPPSHPRWISGGAARAAGPSHHQSLPVRPKGERARPFAMGWEGCPQVLTRAHRRWPISSQGRGASNKTPKRQSGTAAARRPLRPYSEKMNVVTVARRIATTTA